MICWVTGAGGQIGGELCRQLQAADHRVIAIGRGSASPGLARNQWIEWDIGIESRPMEPLEPPDTVFHLAGQTSAYRARGGLELDIQVNVLGFARVLLAALESGSSPYVVAAGAATEVGLVGHRLVNDDDIDNPQTFYDVGKVVQGLYLRQFAREGWLRGCRVKFANVYGGRPSDESDRGFLNRAVKVALAGEPLTYFPDGAYTRDFLHVTDAASALIAAARHQGATSGASFVIGTGRGTPIREALELVSMNVARATGLSVPVLPTPALPGLYAIERRDVAIDSTRFFAATGWRPLTTLESGVAQMVRRSLTDV